MGLEAATLAAIGAGISAAGSVVGGVSSFISSRRQAKVQEQQAAFARKQAKIDRDWETSHT